MKALSDREYIKFDQWFHVDREPFPGEWTSGQGRIKYRIERAVGQYKTDGKLCLMVWTNLDPYDWHKMKQDFYEIDYDEFIQFLDLAIKNEMVTEAGRRMYIKKANTPFVPPWDFHKDVIVYQDDEYILGQKDETAYVKTNSAYYTLSSHGYEPCLYINSSTTIHNAWETIEILETFSTGGQIKSITGRKYNAKDFCKFVERASGYGNINIDEAERLL